MRLQLGQNLQQLKVPSDLFKTRASTHNVTTFKSYFSQLAKLFGKQQTLQLCNQLVKCAQYIHLILQKVIKTKIEPMTRRTDRKYTHISARQLFVEHFAPVMHITLLHLLQWAPSTKAKNVESSSGPSVFSFYTREKVIRRATYLHGV